MSLKEQLESTLKNAKTRIPVNALKIMEKATTELKDTGIEGKTLQNGEKAPEFTLKNHLGEKRSLEGMLKQGPLVVSFYRGGW